MRWDRQNLIRYSGVRFHIFYCNSAGLSDVVRYNGVFVIAGFVKAGCHCTVFLSSYRKQARRRGGSKGSNEPPLKFDNGGLKYK